MKLFLALTKVFSSECPRLCSPLCRNRSIRLFSAGTDSCDVPGALGGLPEHFVSPVATILDAEQMFISIEMALIPFQLFSRAAIVCEYFFLGAKRAVRAQQAGAVAAASEEGNKAERQGAEQHKAS